MLICIETHITCYFPGGGGSAHDITPSTVRLFSDPSVSSEREQLNQVRRWKSVTSTVNQVRPQAINKNDRSFSRKTDDQGLICKFIVVELM